jgi:hypothetical protein
MFFSMSFNTKLNTEVVISTDNLGAAELGFHFVDQVALG